MLSRLLREGRVVSSDIKGLIHELSPVDSSEAEQLDPLTLDSARLFDTVVAAYLLDSSRDAFDDAYLADRYLQVSLAPARGEEGAANDAPARAARTAALALAIREPLENALEREGATRVFSEIEMPLVPVLASMERAGMLVDPERLHALSEGLEGQIDELAVQDSLTCG